MQEQLQIYAATVASAALRHDFVVPLTLIGRNAIFLQEQVADKAIRLPNSNSSIQLVDLCSKAGHDSTRVHELMRVFGREIEPNRAARTGRQLQFDLQKQYLNLNEDVGPMVFSLLNTCRSIYSILRNQEGTDIDTLRLASRMYQSAARAQEMYSGLGHFFRINEIDETSFTLANLANTISSVAAEVRRLGVNQKLKDIPVAGEADADIIESQFILIFQNLFHNAAKFTSTNPAPSIEVAIRRTRFVDLQSAYPEHLRKYAARGEWVEITTKDNGPGIDRRYADKIFDIYFTRDPGNVTSGGTGMGLAIAKLVATLHRGVLFLSKASNPTTFCLAIPQNNRDGISLTALTQLEHALR